MARALSAAAVLLCCVLAASSLPTTLAYGVGRAGSATHGSKLMPEESETSLPRKMVRTLVQGTGWLNFGHPVVNKAVVGQSNNGRIDQIGGNNAASLTQVNQAAIIQKATGNGGNDATLVQNNNAVVNQAGAGNNANIVQANIGTIYQNGANNDASITQSNTARATQTGGGSATVVQYNDATIIQGP